MKKVFIVLCTVILSVADTMAQERTLLASGNAAPGLQPVPATGLSPVEIETIVNKINPYTLYRKGSIVEYAFEKGGEQCKLLVGAGPTYYRLTVAEETIENGLLVAYIKRDFFNKKHKPSKGLLKSFKEQLQRVDLDTAGTCFMTYDITRDMYECNERAGYAMAITKDLKTGDSPVCGTMISKCKPSMGKSFSHTVKYNDFRVVAEEKITTPAGTFDCLKLSGNVTENIDSNNAYVRVPNSKCNIWVARGVGIVRYEIHADGDTPWIMYLNQADIK